jgi:hypothetical protein|tara:strand:+ start:200 stop:376 length:177 start_codon:yes stop_codon:yes gene_type:complete
MKMIEVVTKKIKPLTPKQMVIKRLKQNMENSRRKLSLEKERQRKNRELKRSKRIRNYG